MIQKTIISFISILAILIISCTNIAQPSGKVEEVNNVFDSVRYDRVVAYNYNGEGGIEIVNKQGKLADKILKQVELNKAQINRITNILCFKSSYGGSVAACFDPHFGIVFYKLNKPAAYVSICLDCNYPASSVKLPFEAGFSKEGNQNIKDFERELNF